ERRCAASHHYVLEAAVTSNLFRLLRTIRSEVDPLHASEEHDDRAPLHYEAIDTTSKNFVLTTVMTESRFAIEPRRMRTPSRPDREGGRTFLIRPPAIALSPWAVLHEAEQGPRPSRVRLHVHGARHGEPG